MTKERLIYVLIILFVVRISVFKMGRTSLSLDIYTIFQILITLIIFAVLFFNRENKLLKMFKDKSFKLIVFVYLMGLTSSLWSALPSFSFYMSFQNLVFFFGIFYVFSKVYSFSEMETKFFNFSLILIAIDLFGDIVLSGSLNIFSYHNLETGGIAGVLFCYSSAELYVIKNHKRDKNRKKRLKKMFWIGLFVLIVSTSSGSNVAAIGGLTSIVFFGKQLFPKVLIFILLFVLILFPEIVDILIQTIFPGKSMTAINSFGHRMYLWESIIDLFKQRPVLGWGYASVERIGERYNVDSHNSFLGILGGLGIIGAILYSLFLIQSTMRIIKFRNQIGYWGIFAATICLLINSNTFGFLSSKTSLLTLSFFTLCCLSFFYKYLPYYKNNGYQRKA